MTSSEYLARNLEALEAAYGYGPIGRAGAASAHVEVIAGRPVLSLQADSGRRVAMHGRDPVRDAARWLAPTLATPHPWLTLIGAGLGAPLDAIEAETPERRVLVVETDPGMLDAFLGARDWRPWIERGALAVIGANPPREAAEIWSRLGITTPPPVVVAPVLMREAPTLVIRNRMAFATARFGSLCDPRRPDVGQSMLKYDVIVALEHTATMVGGAILEVGPYVGGSTMAMCRGRRAAGRRAPVVTIERGGAYTTHPSLPSDDIIADLRRNLVRHGMQDMVTVIEGATTDPHVMAAVRRGIGTERVGLLSIDADGCVARDLDLFLPLCAPGALIVVDDYVSPEAPEKVASTREAVDSLIADGRFRPLGLYGWGTWFGIYAGPLDDELTAAGFPYTLAAGVL